ncbi:dihydrolipoamide acetyltransferase family protein [Jatrophihabitans sp. DSM 45814]
MAELKQFKLPDIGEGLTEADILRWDVKVGDTVVVNQTLVEVETAKAAVELPCPFAGTIEEIFFEEGATVDVGQPIVSIKVGSGDLPTATGATLTSPGAPTAGSAGEDLVPTPPADGGLDSGDDASQPSSTSGSANGSVNGSVSAGSSAADNGRQAVLVGYGVSGERGRRRKRSQPDVSPAPSANDVFGVTPGAHAANAVVRPAHAVLAKPPVRKLAKSLGVDLTSVIATGPNGSISRIDVEEASKSPVATAKPADGRRPENVPTGARETRIAIKGVRKHTAAAMVSSAFTAPHVTEFITVDVSEMMELRDRVAARREFQNVKVSPLLFVARAVLWAANRTPIINSTWDEAAAEIIVKHYVNLGIAAATDRGLIVPNIKGAETMSLLELAEAIASLTDIARSGKTPPADMSGGTFTITNVGVFGVDTGTPIINPGEAAILALGSIRRQPWVVGTGAAERIEPRWITQLAVSFDHRSVDGQQGSQFLADVAAILRDPGLAVL